MMGHGEALLAIDFQYFRFTGKQLQAGREFSQLLGFILLSRLTRRLGKANKAADEALAEALSEKGITIDEETLRYAQDDKTGALEDNNDACHAERSEASPAAFPVFSMRFFSASRFRMTFQRSGESSKKTKRKRSKFL